jgi:glycosyltransferase involved in cell wall biosynthesis
LKTSALMSIYVGTLPTELRGTLDSLVNQVQQADEIIVVLDGPVDELVLSILNDYSKNLPLRTIRSATNQGLGLALAKGLAHCSYDWVFRIDSDDIYPPERFALQVTYAKENPSVHAVGGSLMEHYISNDKKTTKYRSVPLTPDRIRRYAKWRNPLNHQTVFFQKKAVLDVGSYQDMPFFEDYFLWARLLLSDYRIANLGCPLAETTVSIDYFRRRGGLSYINNEARFVKSLVQLGFFSRRHGLIFFLFRVIVRQTPNSLRRLLYRIILR